MTRKKCNKPLPKNLPKPKGIYRVAYLLSGPAMTADEYGHMEPMFGKNYYVTEKSEEEGITAEEREQVQSLARKLLEQNPNRTLVIQVEHTRLFD